MTHEQEVCTMFYDTYSDIYSTKPLTFNFKTNKPVSHIENLRRAMYEVPIRNLAQLVLNVIGIDLHSNNDLIEKLMQYSEDLQKLLNALSIAMSNTHIQFVYFDRIYKADWEGLLGEFLSIEHDIRLNIVRIEKQIIMDLFK